MILLFINIHKVPREVLKTLGFALNFQHFLRTLRMLMNGKSCLIALFFVIVYINIPVAGFDAIFDWYLSILGCTLSS